MKNTKQATRIYVIGEGNVGPVKIGIANKPQKRLGELQIGNPRRLTLYLSIPCKDARAAEIWAQGQLAGHLIGGEWYNITAVIAIEIVTNAVTLADNNLISHLITHRHMRDNNGVLERYCSRCESWKPLDQFYPSSVKKIGLQSHCKSCGNDRAKEWAETHRETKNAKQREYSRRKRLRVRWSGTHEMAHQLDKDAKP